MTNNIPPPPQRTELSGASELWKALCDELYSNIDESFLAGFREPHNPANRFSTWPPKEPTFRYYLTLVSNAARAKGEQFFLDYKKLGNTALGSPLCVKVEGIDINLDYLTSLEEFNFLKKTSVLKRVKSVIEVGAGFGRTAHALTKLSSNLESYSIVDLEPMLKLSSEYLRRVVPDQFHKINFVPAHRKNDWATIQADLFVNIDSFQEMPARTIDDYKCGLFSKAPLVYLKNPVCKYNPALLGIDAPRSHDVFSLGYMTEIANIYDEDELAKMRLLYEERYRPSSNHKTICCEPSDLFSYYQHILFEKA
jgi:putative sugar O-methyltransferase